MSLCQQYASYWPAGEQARAACICDAESSGNPNAVGGAGERGLWQILPSAHPECSGDLFDPATNARCAVAVSRNGTNWGPWTTAAGCAWAAGASGGSASPAAVVASVQSTVQDSVAAVSPSTLLLLGAGAVALLLGAESLGNLA